MFKEFSTSGVFDISPHITIKFARFLSRHDQFEWSVALAEKSIDLLPKNPTSPSYSPSITMSYPYRHPQSSYNPGFYGSKASSTEASFGKSIGDEFCEIALGRLNNRDLALQLASKIFDKDRNLSNLKRIDLIKNDPKIGNPNPNPNGDNNSVNPNPNPSILSPEMRVAIAEAKTCIQTHSRNWQESIQILLELSPESFEDRILRGLEQSLFTLKQIVKEEKWRKYLRFMKNSLVEAAMEGIGKGGEIEVMEFVREMAEGGEKLKGEEVFGRYMAAVSGAIRTGNYKEYKGFAEMCGLPYRTLVCPYPLQTRG
eukprot:TRINITY_DN4272_c0_g1_i1.p1 TRINITY_DN4272_c0_g1~~TRINITY_DN4272_c0_g1_i1.p1  ORF type:complete len:313 (+),score=88.38 TRINITY_DN4272_c0_g1_i1:305-1243(+)